MNHGRFITFEGIEGAGKSSNIRYAEALLQANSKSVVVTREPGGTPLGEALRELLLGRRHGAVSSKAELLMMFAARSQHLESKILPAGERGEWVLCDRVSDATYAYQGGGRRLPMATIRELEQLVQGDLRPDYTLLLDAPIDVGMSRARDRGELDRFEQEQSEFFQRVRNTYLQLAGESSGRYRVIDAAKPLADVQVQLQDVCNELATCWGVRQP